MKYQIVGKNITVTEGISCALQKKLAKIDKLISNPDIECRALVSSVGDNAKVEITIFLPQVPLRAEVEHSDLYAGIDLAVDKLEGQMRKLKTKTAKMHEKKSFIESFEMMNVEAENDGTDEDEVIVRSKSYYLTPMTIEEAVIRMEALGHDFFMYLDSEDDRVSVVYIRKDGGYGVIQAENPMK